MATATLITDQDEVEVEVATRLFDVIEDAAANDPKEPVLQSVRFRLFLTNVVVVFLSYVLTQAKIAVDKEMIKFVAELITASIMGYILARSLRNTPQK